jgi:hypothetical protein
MARQDIWNGDGICLIDPHGDLAEDVLLMFQKKEQKMLFILMQEMKKDLWDLNLYEIKLRWSR